MASIAGNIHRENTQTSLAQILLWYCGTDRLLTSIEQYIALGIASRLVSGLGLHREAVCSLPGAEEAGFRILFYVTLYNERITALWQGRPSCMTDVYDTELPEPPYGKEGPAV
jgi:hypothetical protein